MSIKTNNWTAQIDRMPGSPSFRVYGTVTVPHSGATPTLEYMKVQDKSFNVRLELKLETSDEPSLQVETEKFVEYKVMGNSNVPSVSIFYKGELLHHIDKVLITH
ncbi:hypothetical protein T3H00_02330 [Pseudomonas fluorescens]|jgi:hypothetical protein|uniref:hypothetical protein n=1 Tax=Pseudomonas TaxID=286 RepID=UPI001A90DF59|nr:MULTISPECIES: hypothetical protein [Pseudomonas]MDZ5431505.1 hypothetical protein [Pseudomonas fluorescens]